MITSIISHGIKLDIAGYYGSPLTIGPTGVVQGSILGAKGNHSWTVANYGTVLGITLQGYASDVVTNGTGGLVGDPVYLSGTGCTVTNAGTMGALTMKGGFGAEVVANGVNGATSALIGGGTIGIYIRSSAPFKTSVTNAGTIVGGTVGVSFYYGGNINSGVSGATAALISGGRYGVLARQASEVSNAGTIVGTSGAAILDPGGGVRNGVSGATHALIASYGIHIAIAHASYVINYGTIKDPSGGAIYGTSFIQNGPSGATGALILGARYGVYTQLSGSAVFNAGTIAATGGSSAGIRLGASSGDGTTVTNAGTIVGGAAAILFGPGNDRLIIDPGAVFGGIVDGGGGANTIELGAGGSAGTLSGLGSQYLNFTSFAVDAGARWTIAGLSTLANGNVLTIGAGSTLTLAGTLTDQGTLVVGTGALFAAPLLVDAGGSAEFQGPVAVGASIALGAGGTLRIDDLASAPGGMQQQDFNAPIAGLLAGDAILIATAGLGNFTGIDSATRGAFNAGNNTTPLVLTSGGNVVATLTLDGNYASDSFAVSPPAGGVVTVGIPVFNSTDFNADGFGDVLYVDDRIDQLTYAEMVNGAFGGFVAATAPLGTLSAVGHGDVNGDGFADVVVQDPNTGQIYFGEQNGQPHSPTWVLGPDVPGFAAVGVGDIQGNGIGDIVVQNAAGQVDYYDTKHGTFVSVAGVPNFTVVGVGDVNGDGNADIVVQNPTTGEIDYASMAGGVFSGFVAVASTPGYAVKAVADLTGDI